MEKFYNKTVKRILFPLLLCIFPLVKIAVGVELGDTGFSLGNYRFFPGTEGTWVLNTYISHIVGYFFTLLPFGRLMMGVNFYASLLVSVMALAGYRFFITKMPAWVAFLGEMIAIGLCWCPPVILYNYLTYLFFLLGVIFLFRGLVGERPRCLVVAGVCLGINVYVRNPNVTEAALILCVWYYGFLRRKEGKKILRETLLCLAGYVGAFAAVTAVMMLHYGAWAPAEMIGGLLGVAGRSEDYTPLMMVVTILRAYLRGGGWLLYMVVCVLPGIPFLMVRKELFPRIRRILYCLGIVLLFIVLWRWGMYNFKYYQKESALQWAVIFLIISLLNMVWMLFSKAVDVHWKLIASLAIGVILITPLGSNNYVWPIINNLFFVAPATLWWAYKFARWGKACLGAGETGIPLFPLKAMQLAVILMLLVQSLGVGCFYVFRDGETGEPKDTRISYNTVARGMYTTRANAETLEELSAFMDAYPIPAEQPDGQLILYGNIPALSYYLDRRPAISTAWPDLESASVTQLAEELTALTGLNKEKNIKPTVIINASLPDELINNPKKTLIDSYMEENNYRELFRNAQYIVYG